MLRFAETDLLHAVYIYTYMKMKNRGAHYGPISRSRGQRTKWTLFLERTLAGPFLRKIRKVNTLEVGWREKFPSEFRLVISQRNLTSILKAAMPAIKLAGTVNLFGLNRR